MQTFKVFVSSPGDVPVERRRVENVVSRLNGEFAGVARLDTVRWETEAYQAHSTFQAQIPRSTDCDLVIGILKWRLGTELPPDFDERLPNGAPFPSGTAFELLTAIAKRQKGGELPDVYVFRFADASPSVAVEDPNRAAIERDWQALKGFFQDWFVTDRGQFQAAFNPYASEDDFEAQLERLLRKWLADKVAGGRVVRWPIAVKGSPFRGLAAFGAKHAPVFFGRSHDTARAVDLWRAASTRGAPYLLVVGASGAGKSSLAGAGLVPRLTTPGVVVEVDVWRIAVMRPGDSPAGPVAALADALVQDGADARKDDDGRDPALPEIAQGDSRTPAELAAVLRHADATAAVKPVMNALSRVAAAERDRDRYRRDLRCDLVLLIDQLDELFAASVSETERTGFVDLIAALVATGRVWVAATLRADLYARMLGQPALKNLKEQGATYDLAPPGAAELAEIVRRPAAAAGLVFETDPATGESLDARLLREADRPDMLPLVQLALSRLYEARESAGDAVRLPLEAYETLGGLKGIVDEAGETALASLGAADTARLPRLLRQLAVPAQDHDGIGRGALTIRAVPLAQAAPDDAGRRLVDALVTARLLTTSGVAADAQVRLAHQRVLEDWSRARAIVADSADFYRIRADLEESRRKWDAGGRRGELLLARGLPLAEAESVAGKYREELAPAVLAYVRASRARASRAQMIGWSAAAVFLLVAIGAGIAAKVAFDQRAAEERERQRADRNLTVAKQTVDGLIFDIADGLRDVAGMRIDTIRRILDTVQKTNDQLVQSAPDDPRLLRSRAAMFNSFVDTYLAAGDLKDAAAAATQSLDIARRLAARDAGNAQAQHDVSTSLEKVGDVRLQGGDRAGALAAYQESLAIRRNLMARDAADAQARRDVARSLIKVGAAKLLGGDHAGALAAYQESLALRRTRAAQKAGNAQALRDLSVGLEKVADATLQGGDQAGALAAYEESLAIRRKLAAQDPGNVRAQRDVAEGLEKIGDVRMQGGDQKGALAAHQESLIILRTLAAQDPGNASVQRAVSVMLIKVGVVKLRIGDRAGALAACTESLDIARRVAAHDPDDAQAQRDVAVSLENTGNMKMHDGDRAGALAAYQEGLDIRRKLAAPDPGNAQAQHDVSVSLEKIGDVKAADNDRTGAFAAYQESLDISRRLAAHDPGNAQAQRDVSLILDKVGDLKLQSGDQPGALVAYQESLTVFRALAAQDHDNAQVQRDVSVGVARVGDAKYRGGDRAGALVAYQESLDIARRLAAQDPSNTDRQTVLVVSLFKVSALSDPPQARAALTEALSIVEKLERDHKLAADQKNWPDVVRSALSKLP